MAVSVIMQDDKPSRPDGSYDGEVRGPPRGARAEPHRAAGSGTETNRGPAVPYAA